MTVKWPKQPVCRRGYFSLEWGSGQKLTWLAIVRPLAHIEMP